MWFVWCDVLYVITCYCRVSRCFIYIYIYIYVYKYTYIHIYIYIHIAYACMVYSLFRLLSFYFMLRGCRIGEMRGKRGKSGAAQAVPMPIAEKQRRRGPKKGGRGGAAARAGGAAARR